MSSGDVVIVGPFHAERHAPGGVDSLEDDFVGMVDGALADNLDAGGFQLRNVADPEVDQDVVTKGWFEAHPLVTDEDGAEFATVALTGEYDDLTGKPTLGSAAAHAATDFQVAAANLTVLAGLDPTQVGVIVSDGAGWLRKSVAQFRAWLGLAAVAVTGAYADLTGAPAALPPSGAAGGDLTGTYPNPTLGAARALASRQVAAGTGLTGGGDLTADRTLTADFGTGAGKVTQGNDARLSDARTPTAHKSSHATGGTDALSPADIGAVSTGRTVTAGAGLTGGGDLSANRSFAADFGSGAGKVTQGNDARLSDSRTPSAHAASHAAAGVDPVTVTEAQVTGLAADLAAKADLASPTFSGNPLVPTQAAGNDTTRAASTAFVTGAISTQHTVDNGAYEPILVPTDLKTANYSTPGAEMVRWNNTSGNKVQTLPTAPADGTRAGARIDTLGAGNKVTLTAGGSDVFGVVGGAATFDLNYLGESVIVKYRAAEAIWVVVEHGYTKATWVPLPSAPSDGYVLQYNAGTGLWVAGAPSGTTTIRSANTSGTVTALASGVATAIPGISLPLAASATLGWELSASLTVTATSAISGTSQRILIQLIETSNGVDTPVTFYAFCKLPSQSGDYVTVGLPADLGYLGTTARTRTFTMSVTYVGGSANVVNNNLAGLPTVARAQARG